ncbi:MAG TPA: Ig-like domain-containing protein [Verrucomicrobiae bacterium]|jgi:hypothetical protein|nr:Ig-like domain-containing protein [Verrucomicrobiae bacterium]
MKIRNSILSLVAIVALLIALIIWHESKNSAKPSSEVDEPNVAPQVTTPSVATAPPQSSPPAAKPAKGADLSLSPPLSKADRTIGMLSTYNDVPIVFYGRVEDQFSNAVANATVNFDVRVYNGTESTVKRGQVMTDADGFFTVSGYRGQELGLVPKKMGYVLATTGSGTSFKYSKLEEHPYVPDAANPTVIKMWKLQGAEPLVTIDQHYKIPFTGAPIFVDLVTGKIVSTGGDLEIIVKRAAGAITQVNHGDWSVEFAPVNGGIMESDYHTSQVAFSAPENGYQNSLLVQMNHDNPDWFDNIQKVFFLTSRGGQVYSKVSVDFGINSDPGSMMWLQFKGVANANGSRNWEATAH